MWVADQLLLVTPAGQAVNADAGLVLCMKDALELLLDGTVQQNGHDGYLVAALYHYATPLGFDQAAWTLCAARVASFRTPFNFFQVKCI